MRPRKPLAITAAILAAFALHCAAGEKPPDDAPATSSATPITSPTNNCPAPTATPALS